MRVLSWHYVTHPNRTNKQTGVFIIIIKKIWELLWCKQYWVEQRRNTECIFQVRSCRGVRGPGGRRKRQELSLIGLNSTLLSGCSTSNYHLNSCQTFYTYSVIISFKLFHYFPLQVRNYFYLYFLRLFKLAQTHTNHTVRRQENIKKWMGMSGLCWSFWVDIIFSSIFY